MNRSDITIASIHGKAPRIHDSAFIAPGCRIIGDVEIGPDSSIWYNCVIRGDANRIVIGARSNIQDGSVVHCDSPKPKRPHGFPTIIGEAEQDYMYWPLKFHAVAEHWRTTTTWGKLFQRYQQEGHLYQSESKIAT